MFAKIKTAGFFGIQGFMAEAEADAAPGIPQFNLTGALSGETKEAQYRVWNAIKNSGISIRPQKITVNLSPASVRKEGTAYDLAIAMALLCAAGELPSEALLGCAFLGEVGLSGELKPVRGILPLALTARDAGLSCLIVPEENAREAGLANGIRSIGTAGIGMLYHALREALSSGARDEKLWAMVQERIDSQKEKTSIFVPGRGEAFEPDFSEVRGQVYLRRAAEIAASGRHNLLFCGPAGTGKTMIARRMPGILPPLLQEEKIELSKLYSICGMLSEACPLVEKRPFRAPHHSISTAAFAGGGKAVLPGELSLASGGILFLDELPLFRREVLESMRQPMEEQQITVTRLRGSCVYPADFQLVAAQNNCPCGYFPDRSRCRCTRAEIRAYLGRLSRPVLERIDICAEAMPLSFEEISGASLSQLGLEERHAAMKDKRSANKKAANMRAGEKPESSAVIRQRVMQVHEIQKQRFRDIPGLHFNSRMGLSEISRFCVLGREETLFLQDVFRKKEVSGRTYHKILKVARTIADMEGKEKIQVVHLMEAISFRGMEDRLFGTE